jgi:hypothetical protein
MVAKKILFWLWLALSVLCLFSSVTVLQLFPIVVIEGILLLEIYAKKNLQILAIVVSALMLLINIFVTFSLADITIWLATVLVFSFIKEINN